MFHFFKVKFSCAIQNNKNRKLTDWEMMRPTSPGCRNFTVEKSRTCVCVLCALASPFLSEKLTLTCRSSSSPNSAFRCPPPPCSPPPPPPPPPPPWARGRAWTCLQAWAWRRRCCRRRRWPPMPLPGTGLPRGLARSGSRCCRRRAETSAVAAVAVAAAAAAAAAVAAVWHCLAPVSGDCPEAGTEEGWSHPAIESGNVVLRRLVRHLLLFSTVFVLRRRCSTFYDHDLIEDPQGIPLP